MFAGFLQFSGLSWSPGFPFNDEPRNRPAPDGRSCGERVVVVQESGPQRGECFVLERRECYWAVVGESHPPEGAVH